MKWYHAFLYVFSIIWNITICWPAVLLIRLFWGENLRWEQNPNPEVGDGPSLWCDLKSDSWPARTWYRKKVDGEYVENPAWAQERYGKWRTWGGTTFGHGGFYGPGRVVAGEWSGLQEHEHVHVEQFESAMLTGFLYGFAFFITLLILGHTITAIVAGLIAWWAGWPVIGVSNWCTALLRGEPGYRGSIHEELAYHEGDEYERDRHGH